MSVTCTLMHAAVFCKHTPVAIVAIDTILPRKTGLVQEGNGRLMRIGGRWVMGAARSVAEFTKGNNTSAFALGAPEQVARSPLRLAFAAAATSKGTT